MPVLAGMAPFAFAAADIVLDKDEIALLKSLPSREFTAGFGDGADILVTHDDGGARRRMLVEFDVGAADAAYFQLHDRGSLGNTRHRIVTDFGRARPRSHRRQYFFLHARCLPDF